MYVCIHIYAYLYIFFHIYRARLSVQFDVSLISFPGLKKFRDVYMFMCIHVCIFLYIYICIHIYGSLFKCLGHICLCDVMFIFCSCRGIYIFTFLFVRMYIYIYTSICIRIYIHIDYYSYVLDTTACLFDRHF